MSLLRGWKQGLTVVGIFLLVFLGLRYLFPFLLPFMLGLVLALAAEPGAKFLQRSLHFSPAGASFAAVTTVLALLAGAVWLIFSVLARRMLGLLQAFSGAAGQLSEGLDALKGWAVTLTAKAPAALSAPLTRSVEELFQGRGLLDRAAASALDLAGRAAQDLPGLLVTLGTALLSAYMLCPRLPALRARVAAQPVWRDRLRPAWTRLRRTAGQWFRAQLRLSSVTFGIVLGGFFLLGVRQKLPMALFTALVDAVPLLGSGTVLLPWSLASILSGQPVRAVGLLGVYVTALITRSALEPKLLGRQLGLDPLAALMALYAGYRIWGFWGMILAPILTVTARELCRRD